MSAWERSSIIGRCSARPSPRAIWPSTSTSLAEPTRQGTHLPHDSLRKKRTALSAMSSMHARSSSTSSAPEPSIEPAAASDLKSSGVSSAEGGRKPEAGPDGAHALSGRPPATPPARSKMTCRAGVPMAISYTPGRATSPLMPMNLRPAAPFLPCALNHSGPFARIDGTIANVSTLLIAVGFPCSPWVPGNGGLLRGSARLPSSASSSADSSPQM